MADRVRREKDIIKRNVDKYIEATTSAYSKYYEGSPTYVTYYQIDKENSTEDVGLEAVNNLVGADSPTKYRKIYDVTIYGVDALDISNEISERGLQSSVTGEFILKPDSVKPSPGDFFVFDYEGMEEHLFRINDAQFDKITPKKYYRCSFSLYPYNTDDIYNNVIGDFEINYENDGGDTVGIISKTDSTNAEKVKTLVDGLIDKYEKMFYDEDMDTFVFVTDDGKNFWSPYLQHFLHDTKALSKYSKDFMTEIYITDINEYDFPKVYKEQLYRNSIFKNIQMQDPNLSYAETFLVMDETNLKFIRNLPFFNSPREYFVIRPVNDDGTGLDYTNAFLPFFETKLELFKDVDHFHKVHILDDLHLADREEYIKSGDIIYECKRHELEPTKVCIALDAKDEKTGECYTEIRDISLPALMSGTYKFDGMDLFYIIKDYLNDKLEVTDDLLKKLNEYYYKLNVQTYLLMPLIIYILKQSITA